MRTILRGAAALTLGLTCAVTVTACTGDTTIGDTPGRATHASSTPRTGLRTMWSAATTAPPRTVVSDGTRVIVPDVDGGVTALDRATGARLWSDHYGAAGSPMVVGAQAGVVTLVDVEHGLRVLDARTGALRWTRPYWRTPSVASPDPAAALGVLPYQQRDGALAGLSLTTGASRWVRRDLSGVVSATTSDATHIYAITDTYNSTTTTIHALDPRTGRDVWAARLSRFDVTMSYVVVRAAHGAVVALVVHDDDMSTKPGIVFAFDAATGAQRWRAPVGNAAGANRFVVARDVVGLPGVYGILGLDLATGRQVYATPGRDSASDVAAVCGEAVCAKVGYDVLAVDRTGAVVGRDRVESSSAVTLAASQDGTALVYSATEVRRLA